MIFNDAYVIIMPMIRLRLLRHVFVEFISSINAGIPLHAKGLLLSYNCVVDISEKSKTIHVLH